MQIETSEKVLVLIGKAEQLLAFLRSSSVEPVAALDMAMNHMARMQDIAASIKADVAKSDKAAA